MDKDMAISGALVLHTPMAFTGPPSAMAACKVWLSSLSMAAAMSRVSCMADSLRAGPGWADTKAHVSKKGKSITLGKDPETVFF
jgi:hypothetical protein